MTATSELAASQRTVIGKAASKLAQTGDVPAVLYGHGREPLALTLSRHDLELFFAHHSAGSVLVGLSVDGKKPINAMVREVQHSPVKGTMLHVDFVEVSMNEVVHAVLPLHLVNDPQGVKAGGILTVNIHEINVSSKPGDLPEVLEWDVAALEIGDSLHVGQIVPPKGVSITDDPEAVVASVQTPRVEMETEEGAEVTEPEVIGAKTEEE